MVTLTIRSFLIGLGRMPAIPALALSIAFGGFILAPLTVPVPLTPSATLPASSLSLFFPRFSCSTGCENVPCTALVGVAVPPLCEGVPTLPMDTCTGGTAGFVGPGLGRAESGIETGTELCLGSVDDDPGLETADPDTGPGAVDPGL
jgi:hypothetical protein